MTYILGSRCKDGVVLVADRKIVFDDFNIDYRDKLFVDFHRIVMGSSGPVSLFDKFRNKALVEADALITSSEAWSTATEKYISHIEGVTRELNKTYAGIQADLEVLIGIQTDKSAILQHIYPKGFAEIVPKYRAIGHGEAYGSMFLKILWNKDMKMKQAAELGYYIIKYIEKKELDSSVGVGNNKPQIWFIPDEGNLEQANDRLLDQFEVRYKRWIESVENSILQSFTMLPEIGIYALVVVWGSFCDMKSGSGCNNNAPGAHSRGDGQFYYTEGIDIDSSGNIYVAEQGNHRVQKFDRNGNFITKWGGRGKENGKFEQAFAVAIDSLDYVYVSDSSNHRIQKFDINGNFITKWGSYCYRETGLGCNKEAPGAIEDGDGQFNHPMGIVIDKQGFVYVTDQLNNRIQKFDSGGNFITKWGSYGEKQGQFNRPHGITLDKQEKLYITDSLNARIQKFNIDGKFITMWGSRGNGEAQFNIPRDLVVSPTYTVYISDGSNHRIQVFAAEMLSIK